MSLVYSAIAADELAVILEVGTKIRVCLLTGNLIVVDEETDKAVGMIDENGFTPLEK